MSLLMKKPKDDYREIEEFNKNSFFNFIAKDKILNHKKLNEFHKKAIASKNFSQVSILMSYLALNNYRQKASYYNTLSLLNDSRYLANSSNNLLAQKINFFCSAIIEFLEKNIETAIDLFKASYLIKVQDKQYDNEILSYKQKVELLQPKKYGKNSPFIHSQIEDEALLALLEVGKSIAVETNIDTLLETIAKQIQNALGADRCTVFLLDKEKNELWSKVALGLEKEEIRFSIDKGLAGHVLKTGEVVNIKNAYESLYFNKEIDLKTGYKTKNILCMPIRNLSHQILGVFQVLNKHEGDFTKKDEELLTAIGASAGIALENANLFNEQKKLIEEQKKLFSSFINTLSASIDARDKITSGHSKRVTAYACLICDKLNLDTNEKEIIKNASLLHDIGKIGIKDSVLQKEGKLTKEEYEHIKQHVIFTHDILINVYSSKNFKDVALIASSHHEKFDGSGYFKGLKGEKIPLGGRILAICDVFDAITSKRHYRNKMDIVDALKIIKDGSNSHFDEKLVKVFMELSCYQILEIICDNKLNVSKNDEFLLREFKLESFCGILNNKECLSKRILKLKSVFDKYYKGSE